MFKNFIIVSLRNLRREARLSLINVFGLSLALAASLVIFLYVSQQLSYDRFTTAERTYRLELRQISDQSPKWAISPVDWMGNYAARISAIEAVMPVDTYFPKTQVTIGDRDFFEDNIFKSNEHMVDMLDLELIGPGAQNALDGPKKVLLSVHHAQKYFGEEDPVGQLISIDGEDGFLVSGVFRSTRPSHIQPDLIVSQVIAPGSQGWHFTYLRLAPGSDPQAVEDQINEMATELTEVFFTDTEYALINMADVYFHSKSKYQLSASGDLNSVYIFAAVGMMILVVACLNFINLTSASLLRYHKEVGIRKILGSVKRLLLYRLMTESGLIMLFSLIIAGAIVYNAVPWANQLWALELNLTELPWIWGLSILVILTGCTLLAASMPVFYLSQSELSKSFKTKKGKSGKSVLMLFQFVVSVLLIIGTFLIKDQLSFLRQRDLGYGGDKILFINAIDPAVLSKSSEYRKRFEGHPSVLYTATIMGAPGDPAMMGNQNAWAEGMPADENIFLPLYAGDEEAVATLGLNVVLGQDFSQGVTVGDSSTAVLVNETAVRQFGWEEPIGKRMKISGRNHTVVGVLEDFHFLSLQNNIGPLAIAYGQNHYMIAIRIKADGVQSAMEHINKQWKTIQAEKPMESFFLQDNFNKQYLHEQRLDNILNVLTSLALIISAIGTLGMMLLIIEQKTKEIGIRKVLGASVTHLLLMLNRQLLMVILLANLIAWPLAYYFSGRWLSTFAYAVKPDLLFYLVAAVITLIVALGALSIQSFRAVKRNPVDVLKHE